MITISILKVRKQRLREVKSVSQSHTARKVTFLRVIPKRLFPGPGCLTPTQNPPVKGQVLPLLSEGQERMKGKM